MKKTRRFISAVMALAMVSAIAPMSAFAETSVSPVGGTPFDVTPNPRTANTEVEFSVDPGYTVTIPASVTLEDDGSGIYTNTGIIDADDVFLKPDQTIVVTISGDFELENEIDSDITVAYQAEGSEGIAGNGGVVATFNTSADHQSVEVEFSTLEEPQYAGKYSDTVTFGIAVETNTMN